MKLFAVIYLKGALASAMLLWPGATVQDCDKINAQWLSELPSTPGIKSGLVQLEHPHSLFGAERTLTEVLACNAQSCRTKFEKF